MHKHVGKGRCDLACIIKLANAFLPKGHALGAIHHHITAQVCVRLEFTNVIPIGPGQHAPVQEARVITGHVFSVLSKFHTGATVGAFVMPDNVAHHRLARVQKLSGQAR